MIRLPKYVVREGNFYVLRHPSGHVVGLGSSLLEAKAKHAEAMREADMATSGARSAIAYGRLRHGMWTKVDVQGRSQCWPWKGAVDRDGYGYLGSQRVHRIAWMDFNHQLAPASLVIRHVCDNPRCCNPWHLESGTQIDNVRDRCERQRTARGRANGRAKLTDQQALEVFADDSSYRDIAGRFGISKEAVRDIKTGRNWAWLTGAISHGPDGAPAHGKCDPETEAKRQLSR